ncbi:MAG: hypothetical protein SGARI_005101 [Bacillariaceae sp.]
MKFTYKTVAAALFLLSSAADAAPRGTRILSQKDDLTSAAADQRSLSKDDDLTCDAPVAGVPSCEGMGVGRSLGNVITDCQTNIRRAGYYYFEDDIKCTDDADSTAIRIAPAGDGKIDGTVIVDCKGTYLAL